MSAGEVGFDRIRKLIPFSRGGYQLVFGAIYELYIDKTLAPVIAADLFPKVVSYLHEFWPDKYPDGRDGGVYGAYFTEYPENEKLVLLRATKRFLRDFEQDRLDPHLLDCDVNAALFIRALRNLVRLVQEDMAAPPKAPGEQQLTTPYVVVPTDIDGAGGDQQTAARNAAPDPMIGRPGSQHPRRNFVPVCAP